MNSIKLRLISLFALLMSANALGVSIEPPKAELVDDFGINLTDGQVMRSVPTLSIGGEYGLSHAVNIQTNHFNTKGRYGYNDTFEGYASYTLLGKKINWGGGDTKPAYVMKVWGPGGSADFAVRIDGGGRIKNASSYEGSDFTYESIGDKRQILEIDSNNQLVWTQPDGTIYIYERGGQFAKNGGTLRKIIHANGFEINIKPGGGVSTNTGFQLFYGFEPDNRPASSATVNAFGSEGFGSTLTYQSDIWARKNPSFIKAINNSVEYCRFSSLESTLSDNQLAEQCRDKINKWPTAEFDWPAGMPLAFYAEENDFVITDSGGGKTKLHFTPYNLTKRNPSDPLYDPNCDSNITSSTQPSHCDNQVDSPGQIDWSPRLTAVTPPGATEPVWQYDYGNAYYSETLSSGGAGIHSEFIVTRLKGEAGVIRYAHGPKGTADYRNIGVIAHPERDNETFNTAEYKGALLTRWLRVKTGHDEIAPGSIWEAMLEDDAHYWFDSQRPNRGFIRKAYYFTKGWEDYEYNIRDNLTKITYQKGISNETTRTANYPSSCPVAERKRCNKPTWVKDRNDNVTNFTYHQQSGQVLTETGPADDNGIRPQTRYEYAQYSARYYNPYDDGTLGLLVQGSPIWLLKRESYCRTSSATSNGCTAANDEVVTEYDYGPASGPNNLFLRGVKVTAAGEPSRLTCYTYDIYGNQIGVTTPKADKTSCY